MSNDKLAKALREAAASLRTLERSAMREEYLDDPYSVRAYARSRAEVAENALQAHAAEAAQTRDTMTPRELAKRIGRGENWKMVDEPAQAQAQSGECQRNSPAGCDCIDTCVAISQPQAAEPVYQVKFPGDEGWCDTSIEDYTSMDHCTRRVLYTRPQPAQDASKYQELLMAVEKKFPGESRHETALRYIRETELQSCEPKCDAAMAKESGR